MRLVSQPEIVSALWWFEQTHELVPTMGGAYWRLGWLPHPGSVSEQDAWLWDALQIVRTERMQLLADSKGHDDLKAWRRRKRGE